jgi:hypothetical protein
MKRIRNYCLLVAAAAVLGGCHHKKKTSASGEDPVEVSDFIDFFPAKNLPYYFSDTTLNKKEKDSGFINHKIFIQFVPDSFLNKIFGKEVKPKIYPMARVKGEGVTYLFTKAVSGDKKGAFVFAFDKKEHFMDGIPVLQVDPSPSTQQSASMDKNFGIYKMITRKNPDGSAGEGKDIYVLNNDTKKFILIMTKALDDKITEVINPIDTFSRRNKYSADYSTGKLNLVSIRDGRKNDRLSFFIHFDKNDGACTGELKGEAILRSASVAEYRQGGDPCVLRFSFTSSAVVVKELEGCGSHRGLRCSFDGTFPRKKEAKPKTVKKKTTKKG